MAWKSTISVIFLLLIFWDCQANLLFPSVENGKRVEFTLKKPEKIRPLVLIPGLGGSSLDAKLNHVHEEHWWCFKNSDWYRIWFNIADIIPHLTGECLKFNMQPFYDKETRQYSNRKGIDIRPTDFGSTKGIEYLTPFAKKKAQYFKVLVEYFVDAGYERGKSIRGAPYDFRLTPRELERIGYFQRLKELVEDTYEINNKTKVHLLGHSLGGPMGSLFLGKYCDQEWKDKYIAGYFSVAPSYDGSVYSIGSLQLGKYSEIPLDISNIIEVAGGLAWMIPKHNNIDDIIVYSHQKNYTRRNIDQLFKDMGFSKTVDVYKDAIDSEYDPLNYPPKVKTHCCYGVGRKTPTSLFFSNFGKREDYGFVDYTDGDCTVPKYSSHFCSQFEQEQEIKTHEFKGEKFKDEDYHRYIVCDKEFLDSLFTEMYND